MFFEGDRVKLISDFDNGPGIIPAETEGTVLAITESAYVIVRWDDVSDLQEYVQHNNKVAGLYMMPEEVTHV